MTADGLRAGTPATPRSSGVGTDGRRTMRYIASALLCVLAAGCALRRPATPPPATLPAPATRPADAAAGLSLDEIAPALPLVPATQSTARAPLEALHLYARACAARFAGDRAAEIALLQKALELDPWSFWLNYSMGLARMGQGAPDAGALEALQRAVQIRPDHLDAQLQLGRLYLVRGDMSAAIRHLRQATLSPDYRLRPETAALVDALLARALQQKGYTRAALDQYEILAARLASRLNYRGRPELWYFQNHADSIFASMADLNQQLGRYEEALRCWGEAIARSPANFSHHAKLVRLLLKMERAEAAWRLALELLVDCRGSPESVELLREVVRSAPRHEAQILSELRRLRQSRPTDRALLFAIADVMCAGGHHQQAIAVLSEALGSSAWEPLVVWKLFDVYEAQRDGPAAAGLLMAALQCRPDTAGDLQPLWLRLLRGPKGFRMRLEELARMHYPAARAPARCYWLARTAAYSGRRALARQYLQQALSHDPAFAPACLEAAIDCLQRTDWSDQEKAAAVEQLAASAERSGRQALAHRLRGLLLTEQRKYGEAAEAFARAAAAGDQSPQVRYLQGLALLAGGRSSEAQAVLWKCVAESPAYSPAAEVLFRHYLQQRTTEGLQQAERVVQTTVAGDPFGVSARLLQLQLLAIRGQLGEARALSERLFRDNPEDPEVVGVLVELHRGRDSDLIARLEDQRSMHPENRVVVRHLAARYHAASRMDDVRRVLDALGAAAGDDADALFELADMYHEAGMKDAAEKTLLRALRLDAGHPGANNYLGYMWAEEGRNLAEAERMIRAALEADPDNRAYRDSLGWVLYRRGDFERAWIHLQAAAACARPDAVVLDHLGDVLYRLKRTDEALRTWEQALVRAEEQTVQREEIVRLRVRLRDKIEQCRKGLAVEVAPATQPAMQTTD